MQQQWLNVLDKKIYGAKFPVGVSIPKIWQAFFFLCSKRVKSIDCLTWVFANISFRMNLICQLHTDARGLYHRRLHRMILILLGHDFQQNGVLPSTGLQGTVVNSLWTTDNDNHTGHRSVLNFVTMINAVRFIIDSMRQKKRKTTIMFTNCYICFFVRYLLQSSI